MQQQHIRWCCASLAIVMQMWDSAFSTNLEEMIHSVRDDVGEILHREHALADERKCLYWKTKQLLLLLLRLS